MGSLNDMDCPQNDNHTLSNDTSTTKPLLDPEELRRQGHMVVDFIADYYKNIDKYPVRSPVEPGYLRKLLPDSAPADPEPIEAILGDVESYIVPGLTHWMSPNYFAYYPNSGSVAGFIGELLCTGFNVVGFNWVSSPAATELEGIVMDWLGEMLKLPKSFLFSGNLGGGGVIQGTTCEAILCTLVAARDRALDRAGKDAIGRLAVYSSDQTHSAFRKAAQIAGLDMRNFRVIETSRDSWFSMSPEKLRLAVKADVDAGLFPTYVCATVGTTSTASMDPLGPICGVAREYGMWVHVDAAYAGSACICPEFRHFIDGVEGATSFSFNAHKWLFTQLDCCCLWVSDARSLIRALSTDPEYLRNKASDSRRVVDYKDWQIPLSRRFRALKLWLVLRSYGVERLRAMLRKHVKIAKALEGLVKDDPRFEVVVPRNLSMVCFRVSPSAILIKPTTNDVIINEVNNKLMEAINASGRASMTHSVVDGVFFMRFVVGATLTEESHVLAVWKAVKELAGPIIADAAYL